MFGKSLQTLMQLLRGLTLFARAGPRLTSPSYRAPWSRSTQSNFEQAKGSTCDLYLVLYPSLSFCI